MVAAQVGLRPGEFIWVGGDCHIYNNHLDQVREQLHPGGVPVPAARTGAGRSLFDYAYEHFRLVDYRHHPALRAPVAV